MFIGICGSICAGKSTVAQYLVQHHGFSRLHISRAVNENNGHRNHAATTDGLQASESAKVNGTTAKSVPASQPVIFSTSEQLLDFVTKQWRERWVTTDITSVKDLDSFSRRPFFLLISVDAPVTVRWRRSVRERMSNAQVDPSNLNGANENGKRPDSESLDDFVDRSDVQLYDAEDGQLSLMSRATVRLLNTSPDIAHLFAMLGKVDLLNEDRLRPSWDTYFMALASLAAQRSNCMKRRVGCVLAREKRVISTGYNGTPRGLQNCGKGGCGRCNEGHSSGVGLATCLCLHAEENALLEAGRERIRDGAILYCDTCPCLTCSIKIAQVGISEVVYSQGYSMDQETARVLREAGVKLRQFVPPANGLIHLERTELY